MAKGNTQAKRGRPRRNPVQSQGSISAIIRNEVNAIVGVCEACNRPLHSVAPIAKDMDVAPVILAGFLKGTKGLSQDTLDRVYLWVENYKKNPYPLDTAEVSADAESATA